MAGGCSTGFSFGLPQDLSAHARSLDELRALIVQDARKREKKMRNNLRAIPEHQVSSCSVDEGLSATVSLRPPPP
jgi:hypothetical protein